MREYEVMLILPAEAEDRVVGGVTDRISQVLGSSEGRITNVDRWGRRRFAYPIDKLTEGFYLVAEFEADPGTLKELERVLSLADDVIRFKVTVRPERAKGAARVVPEVSTEAAPGFGPGPPGPVPEPTAEAAEQEPASIAEQPAEAQPSGDEESASVSNTGAS